MCICPLEDKSGSPALHHPQRTNCMVFYMPASCLLAPPDQGLLEDGDHIRSSCVPRRPRTGLAERESAQEM